MSQKALSQNIEVSKGLTTQDITTDTTTTGDIIDTKGFESLTYIISSGTVTDGTYTPLVNESDDSGMAGETVVPADRLLETIASATFISTDDDAKKKLGVTNIKRFVTLDIVSTGTSTGATNMGVTAVRGDQLHTNITVP